MKRFNVLVIAMLIFLALPLVNAFEFDNVGSYNETTREITITNALGLGDVIGKARLNTPLDNHVPLGYQKVAEFDLWAYEDYNDVLKELQLFDKKYKDWDKHKFTREYDYKYRTYDDVLVEDYELQCEDVIVNVTNTTQVCNNVIVGQHTEQREVWTKITPADLKKNDYITIGIFTNVKANDKVEWIPSIYGVEVNSWAVWTADLNVDIISYWKFDESSGDAIDSVGSHNGTVNGATQNVAGKINTAYSYDGSSDYVDMGDITISATRSIFGWVKLTTTGSTEMVMGGDANGAVQFYIASDGALQGGLVGQGGQGTTSLKILDTNWHFVGVTYNSGAYNFYLDASTESPGSTTNTITNTNIRIGLDNGNYFDGTIDEVGIWDRVLSTAEATQLYNGGDGISYTTVFDSLSTTLIFPENNTIFGTDNINFQCNVSSQSEIANLSLIIDDVIVLTNSTSGRLNLTIDSDQTLSEGNHNWTCEGNNINDLTETPNVRYLEVDTIDPIITINKPLNQSYIFSELDYYNITTNELVDTCYFELNAVEYNMTTSDNLTWSRTNDISQSEGNHTVLFTCKDNVNNEGFKTAEYNLQYVSLNSPADNLLINNPEVTFNVSVDTITGNDISNVSLYTNESGSWVIKSSKFTDVLINSSSINNINNAFDGQDSTYASISGGSITTLTTSLGRTFLKERYIEDISFKAYATIGELADSNIKFNLEYYNGTGWTLENQWAYSFGDGFTKELNNTYSINKNVSGLRLKIETYNIGVPTTIEQRWLEFNYTDFLQVNDTNPIFNESITNDLFWNSEVCYDDGNCYFAEDNRTLLVSKTSPSITITSPITSYDTLSNGQAIDLNVTITTDGTLDVCQYEYNGANNTVSCNVNTTFNYVEDTNSLIYCVNDTLGNAACDSKGWTVNIIEISQTYPITSVESGTETYTANLTYDDNNFNVVTGVLNLNGTNYIGSTTLNGDNAFLTTEAIMPSVTEQTNFTSYWTIALTNETGIYYYNLTSHEVSVGIINFSLCESPNDIPFWNFTVYNESNSIEINSSFEGTFNVYSIGSSQANTFSYSDTSDNNSQFDFCISPSTENYRISSSIKLSKSGFVDKFYNFEDVIVSNATNEDNLYMMATEDSTSFIVHVTDTAGRNLEEGEVQVQRYYPGTNIWATTEILTTNYVGEAIGHLLSEDADYRFKVYKTGVSLLNSSKTKIVCAIAPCTVTLLISLQLDTGYEELEDLSSSLTYSDTTNTFTYTYSDTSTSLASARLHVQKIFPTNATQPVICNETKTDFSGTMTCDISGQVNGTYRASGYITRGTTETLVNRLDASLGTNIYNGMGFDGVLWAIFILMGIIMLGVTRPSMAIIFGAIGLITVSVLNIINIGVVSIIAVIGIGIILLTRVGRE